MTAPKEVEVPARDGTLLPGSFFEPRRTTGPFVLVGSAMGVPRSFYAPFARHLAHRGHPALTLDYRGIGEAAPDRLRGSDATLLDWARLDLAGTLDWIEEVHDPGRLVMAGHSVAGQLFGLVPGNERVEALASVATVKGHWRLWPVHQRVPLLVLWYGLVPLLTRAFGYFPARLSGLGGEDLPAGVALQWAHWGRHRDYMVDEAGRALHEGFAGYRGRVQALSVADDWYAPHGPVQAWLDLFERAQTEHRHLKPTALGLEGMGHFGFFRRPGREAGLWDELARWLREKR